MYVLGCEFEQESLLTMTPSQMTAPVQLEALSVAVRGAYGQPVAGKKVRSACAALGQSLRFIQLLAFMSARSSHRELPRIKPWPLATLGDAG